MTDYLDQFSEFSKGITQSTARSTEAFASGIAAAAKIKAAREQAQFESSIKTVSYTHLTLPTKRIV